MRVTLALLAVSVALFGGAESFAGSSVGRQRRTLPSKVTLYAKTERKKSKGVYVRPSGAIERGSGFFVPGLEGSRVRLVFGGVLLVLAGINHVLSESAVATLSLPEQVALVYSMLVLFQAAIEYSKETKLADAPAAETAPSTSTDTVGTADRPKPADAASLTQAWAASCELSTASRERAQWIAASFISLTPATQMMLLSRAKGDSSSGAGCYEVAYRLGAHGDNDDDTESTTEGVRAAFDELDRSKSGRLALPGDSHPTALSLVPDASQRRSVVLQSVRTELNDNREYAWLVASDQLLAKYGRQDLRWLGQLAKY